MAQRLKVVLADGRAHAEKLLLKDRQGRRCAERLCAMTDDIIQRAVRVRPQASLSVGKSRRKRSGWRSWRPAATAAACMAPGSDIDLLFLLPYKQTAWGESVAEADPLLPVGSWA